MSAFQGRKRMFWATFVYLIPLLGLVSSGCDISETRQCSSRYCFTKPFNNSCAGVDQVSCNLHQTFNCDSFASIQWPQVEDERRPVKILYIEVHNSSQPLAGKQLLRLRFSFQLPGGVYLSSIKAVQVTVHLLTSDGKVSTDSASQTCPSCQMFDFRNIKQEQCDQVQPPTFQVDCFHNLSPGGAYRLVFSTLPLNVTTQLTVTLPKDLRAIDPPSIDVWRSVLTISLTDTNLKVLFQRAPSRFKITRYELKLWNTNSASPTTHYVDNTTNTFTKLNLDTGEYYITLRALSDRCISGACPMAMSKHFIVSSSTGQGGPVTGPVPTQKVYLQSVELVIGIVGGLFLVIALIVISVACYCRRKSRFAGGFQMRRFENAPPLNTSEIEFRQFPKVLILYSYDCPPHEKVVQAFALYIKETCNFDVRLDVWHQNEVQERGSHEWVGYELDSADAVIVVCSVGARFKCSRHRQKYRVKHDQGMTDIFRRAVEMVSQRMWYAVNHTEFVRDVKFAAVYFPYCTESDVPHKLDQAPKFSLMKEISQLFGHLNSKMDKSSITSVDLDDETFMLSDSGSELHSAILEAEEFFRSNPNWFQERVEVRHQHTQKESPRDSSRQGSEEKIQEVKEQDNLHTSKKGSLESEKPSDRNGQPSVPETDCDVSLDQKVPPQFNTQNGGHQSNGINTKNAKKKDLKFLDEPDSDMSQEQLDRDVSFIQNFDQELLKRSTQDPFHPNESFLPWSNGISTNSLTLTTQPT